MASVLSTLGLTASVPDPTELLKQREVSSQLEEVRGSVNSTLGTVGFAIEAARVLGVPPSAVSNLEGLQKRAEELSQATNLTPAQMEAKRAEIEQGLATARAEQEALTRAAELSRAEEVAAAVAAERKRVEGDATLPRTLADSLKQLDERCQAALKAVLEAVAAKKNPADSVETASALQSALDALVSERLAVENKENSGGVRAIEESIKWGAGGLMIFFIVGAALLGGIVLSNTHYEEVFWGIRLYYFIYGTLFFPLSLLYGVWKPPVWQSTLIPWTVRTEVDAATSSERLFSYHIYTEPERVAEIAPGLKRGDILERGRSMLRWFSLAGLVLTGVAGGVLGYLFR
jgi:hypothetical protein